MINHTTLHLYFIVTNSLAHTTTVPICTKTGGAPANAHTTMMQSTRCSTVMVALIETIKTELVKCFCYTEYVKI